MFEFDGKKYAQASAHQKEWGKKLIGDLDLKGDEHILDLGCGDRALTAQLADMVPQGSVLGIDASQGMIDATSVNQRNNLRFTLMDINSLDFENEFDIVFSSATLHWVKDHEKLLKQTCAALKETGFLRFNFAAEGNCSNFFRTVKTAMALPEYSHYFIDFAWPWFMPEVDQYLALARRTPLRDKRSGARMPTDIYRTRQQ